MRIRIIIALFLSLVVLVLNGANSTPILVGGGGTPANSIQFPENATRAFIQAISGALTISAGGTNKGISLAPTGTGAVSATSGATFPFAVNGAGAGNMGMVLNSSTGHNASYVWQNAGANVWYLGNIPGSSNNLLLLNSDANGNSTLMTIQQTASPTISIAGTIASSSGGFQFPDSTTQASTARYQMSFQPGLLTSLGSNKTAYAKVSQGSTVDNLIGSAMTFTCSVNPTITFYECGTSTTCASPTTIGTVTVTAANTAVVGTVSNPSITAGDYVAWAFSGGACTSLDIAGTAQVHGN